MDMKAILVGCCLSVGFANAGLIVPTGCVDKSTDLWCPGAEGMQPASDADSAYSCYKIPVLLRTGNGTLIAMMEARKTELCGDQGDVDLRSRRSFDNGATWTQSSLVWGESTKDQHHTIGDAQPVWDRATGEVHLVFTKDNHDVFYMKSLDQGATWESPPQNISDQIDGHDANFIGTGHASGLQLSTGRLIVMLHGYGINCRVIYSDDHGKRWKKGGSIPGDECQAAEIHPGLIVITARNSQCLFGYTKIAYSTDDGMTLQGGENHDLKSPCKGVDASIVVHPNGKLYHSQPDDWYLREQMVVKVSEDHGKTWKNHKKVWSSAAGYSAMVVLGNSTDSPIGLLYERNTYVSPYFVPHAQTFTTVSVTESDADDLAHSIVI